MRMNLKLQKKLLYMKFTMEVRDWVRNKVIDGVGDCDGVKVELEIERESETVGDEAG